METHTIQPDLLRRRVRVLVVGCGATGSAVVAGLPYLHQALIAYGHPGGLHVMVMDGDLNFSHQLCAPAFQSLRIRPLQGRRVGESAESLLELGLGSLAGAPERQGTARQD